MLNGSEKPAAPRHMTMTTLTTAVAEGPHKAVVMRDTAQTEALEQAVIEPLDLGEDLLAEGPSVALQQPPQPRLYSGSIQRLQTLYSAKVVPPPPPLAPPPPAGTKTCCSSSHLLRLEVTNPSRRESFSEIF